MSGGAAGIDPGRVRILLRWLDGRIVEAGADLQRPSLVAHFRGADAVESVRRLPLIYSICGKAQALAARLALAAARGETVATCHEAAVEQEAWREHLWRLWLDWPRVLGLAPSERLLGEGVRRLAAPDFADWLDHHLPEQAQQLRAALDGIECPQALATVLTRELERRCVELCTPGQLGRGTASSPAAGHGRATVSTARGALLHELTLDGARVADYRIVAPTDVQCAAAGPLVEWLTGAAAPSPAAAQRLGELALLALDPCVPAAVVVAGDG